MNWHYVSNGQATGPVSEEELDRLVQTGTITVDTYIWREGMADWQPYSQARGIAAPGSVSASGGGVVCAGCGQSFALNQVAQVGSQWVCPSCQPRFVPAAGVTTATNLRYAGFWIRFAAVFIDRLILGAVGGVVFGVLAATVMAGVFRQLSQASSNPDPSALVAAVVALYAVGGGIMFVVNVLYETILVGKYGATWGKMACGLRVVRASGAEMTYGVACGRYFGKILSGIILAIGYIMAAFDDEKRALHDRICGTRVIRK